MLIVHIGSELSPIAKVGGLGDVVFGLSKELLRQGHQVQIILPKYSSLPMESLTQVSCFLKQSFSLKDGSTLKVSFWKARYQDLSLILIDPEPPKALFQRDHIYGEADDIDRFLTFCFLALEYVASCITSPAILHLHDWPAAFTACLYKELYQQVLPFKHKIILTLHNILHQGKCLPSSLKKFGIEKNTLLEDPVSPELINLLKGGICYADHVVAVSPTYAEEITTEFGYYLEPTLLAHKKKLSGILNGIDLHYWDPSHDPLLASPYPVSKDLSQIMQAKAKNRAHLTRLLPLKKEAPLFSCITRLDFQKGPDLIAHAIPIILEQGGQCIILGKALDPKVAHQFSLLQERYAHNPHIHFHKEFNETLAHLVYAASDFIFIPSLFEPCGLTQMIGMRYYTIPIVRKTGGLADTVHDIDDPHVPHEKKVGICFKEFSTQAVDTALHRAFSLYADKSRLIAVLKNLSLQDFSWKESVKHYLLIYEN
jgi:starch synthase